ncbi:GBP family porin [Paraburkholderia youngii]
MDMRKKLLAGAIAALASVGVHAQSSVTLYGIIDNGLTYVNNVKGSSQFKLDDGINQASRWGLRGVEDLGGGLKAIFTLENGFSLNTGTASHGGALFGRRAFVGLTSDRFGTLIAGYDYDFIYDYISYYTNVAQFAPSYAFHGSYDVDRLAGEPVSNMVRYETPIWHGFGAGVMYGFSNTPGRLGGTFNGAASVFSAGLKYSPTGSLKAPYSLAASFTRTQGGAVGATGGPGAGTMAQYALQADAIYTAALAGQVRLGDRFALNGVYTYTSANSRTLGTVVSSGYEAGLTYEASPFMTFGAGFTYMDQRQLGKFNLYSFGADYRLSKRTDVYAFGTLQHAFAGRQFADNFLISTPMSYGASVGTNAIFGNGRSSTANQLAVQVGIRHLF